MIVEIEIRITEQTGRNGYLSQHGSHPAKYSATTF